ncbi:hypothetical protein LB505_003729 [Fusarium chuoi]|nr:hypothetical protein LB505_003729 [Fusarium chuoi]
MAAQVDRALSYMTFKPDTCTREREAPYLNEEGYVDFSPDDLENPRNWSPKRRWAITCVAVLLAMNGNFASSIFSGSIDSVMEEGCCELDNYNVFARLLRRAICLCATF